MNEDITINPERTNRGVQQMQHEDLFMQRADDMQMPMLISVRHVAVMSVRMCVLSAVRIWMETRLSVLSVVVRGAVSSVLSVIR